MIGWVVALFVPAFISLLLASIFNNKIKAIKERTKFEMWLLKNENQFHTTVSQIVKNKIYDYSNGVIEKGINVKLISRTNSEIRVYVVNHHNNYVISDKRYNKLMVKFERKRVVYTFSMDSFSLYYRCNEPYADSILWLNYPQNIFDTTKSMN